MTRPARLSLETMAGPFVLPPDAVLAPTHVLDSSVRRRINARSDDYTLSRPGIRVGAKLVDAGTAALLAHFRSPTTIVDAIVNRSRVTGDDPHELLHASHPALLGFIQSGLLLSSAAAAPEPRAPSRRIGDIVCGCVIRSTLQILSDSEVYLADRSPADPRPVVLKLARESQGESLADVEHEGVVLAHINGGIAPRLIEAGTVDGLGFLVMEFARGVDAGRAAADLRSVDARASRTRVALLAADIADTYAELHRRGVIHGDVHDGNVLVDRDGSVVLIDFGLSVQMDRMQDRRMRRGGHSFYYEPEFARASLAGTPAPPATMKSDQYSLAAMLYQLITGAPYVDFELDEPRAFSQIVRAPMIAFARRGAAPWPALERALARALEKLPEDRFASAADFAHALRDAATSATDTSRGRRRRDPVEARRERVVSQTLGRLCREGAHAIALQPPTASVMFGSAGIAFSLYRLSLLKNDAVLLSHADAWSTKAHAARRFRHAFYDGNDLARGAFGHATLFYGSSGVDAVRACIAIALGDFLTLRATLRRLSSLPVRAGSPLDCVLGMPGALIGLSQVLEALPMHPSVDPRPLVHAGDACARLISRALATRRPIPDERVFVNLGIAHGWAGALYALMRWHQASGSRLSLQVRRRLTELAALAEPADRGVRWPWRDVISDGSVPASYMPGWCNGSAGFVHLWLTALSVFNEPHFLQLAEGAAWDAYEDPEDSVHDLCCGRAGRAYSLLALHRATGADCWLARARQLANDALDLVAETSDASPALYKGAMGAILLHVELDQPHLARMPLFEREGWPSHSLRQEAR
ncbi:MAG: lanthionine synthetase LanC family protein [Gemmatimonas sp.]